MEVKQMGMGQAISREVAAVCCNSCGRPLELWCEDCGCPVSCHDFIYPKAGERVPYCLWDFGPCRKEIRPVFLTAVEAWLRDRERRLPERRQAA